MTPITASALPGAATNGAPAGIPTQHEPWRPLHHFSPQQHWCNDPNGLVFVDGIYHLFYQYNPDGDQWGNMSWGHATSPDLAHWQEQPVALHCTPTEMAFSGTVVVDKNNTSGLAPVGFLGPLLVALYTGFNPLTKVQAQCLAWSIDRGCTFTRYQGNPVLDIGSHEFRDPKVLWHEPSQRWVMLVVKALEQQVWIYTSGDLKRWNRVSTFGPAGSCDSNIWEMPDLFELPVANAPGTSRWVLVVSVNHGTLWGGSGVQYFIGDFDGEQFTADDQTWWPSSVPARSDWPPVAQRTRWADHGRDFYAPMSFSHVPDGRVLWLGWMSNWAYAKDLPTTPWRGQQSMPRELSLVSTAQGLRLRQSIVPETLVALCPRVVLDLADVTSGTAVAQVQAAAIHTGALRVQLTLSALAMTEPVVLSALASHHESVAIGFDPTANCYFVQRGAQVKRFAGDGERHTAPRLFPQGSRIELDLWVDHSTIEIFADDGTVVISDVAYNDPQSLGIALHMPEGHYHVDRLVVSVLDASR